MTNVQTAINDFLAKRDQEWGDRLIGEILEAFPHDWLTKERILLLSLSGSRAYGINFPDSDWDIVGVVIPPIDTIIGNQEWKSWHHVTDDLDVRLYSPAQFTHMLAKGSVNNLESLFLPTIIEHEWFEFLFMVRHNFITSSTINSIIGYTTSTLSRFDRLDSAKHGSKRKAYIEQYGYDVAGAAHCFRWLWMGLDLQSNLDELTIEMYEQRKLFLWTVKTGKLHVDQVREYINKYLTRFKALEEGLKLDLEVRTNSVKELANLILIQLHQKILAKYG